MMIGDDRILFLDTNILVYAGVIESRFHQETLRQINKLEKDRFELWISRQIMREYMACLTRPNQFSKIVPFSIILPQIRQFLIRFRIIEDNSLVFQNLLSIIEKIPTGGKQIHDANIVATMMAYNIRHLLTYNISDFLRFSEYITPISPETMDCDKL